MCCLCLLLVAWHTNAQTKPEIQISFAIEQNNFFYDLFEDDINVIKTEGSNILTQGLNTYISFLNFTEEAAAHQLSITLKKDPLSTGIIEEYLLTFSLKDADGQGHEHSWKFLDDESFNALDGSSEVLLNLLSSKWRLYLRGAYNNELVANLFENIPLTLPDSSHYYVSGDKREAILPFRNEELQMVLDDCEFTVKVNGKNNDGVNTTQILKGLGFAGIVEKNTPGIQEALHECIRIGLSSLEQMQLLDGLVFITDFARMEVPENATPGDFLTSVNQ